MYLIAEGLEKIPASKIEKGEDYIKVYDENNVVTNVFKGIPDFSKFSVEGGEFTEAPLDDITQLQLAIAELAEVVANG